MLWASYAHKVFPQGLMETALSDGSEGILYTDRPLEQFDPTSLPGGTCGILGAGNFDSPTDIVTCLWLENKVRFSLFCFSWHARVCLSYSSFFDCIIPPFQCSIVCVCVRAQTAVFKPNPVNHHSSVHTQRVFKPLVDAGYLGFVFGAREAGTALVEK